MLTFLAIVCIDTTYQQHKVAYKIHAFFISNIFISNTKLKLVKIRAKAENYVISSSTLSSKDNRRYPKKCAKNEYDYLNEVI